MFLENISNFIFNANLENASEKTLTVIKAAFLDFFGVTYRGFKEDSVQIAIKSLSEIFSIQDFSKLTSSVIGADDISMNILAAAFLNGIAAHTLDLDDGHRLAQIHLGAVIFPTALSISEAYDLSGEEFLEAVIVGYEVGILLGQLVNPEHRNKGFHTTGTIGTFIAGAVAAKLLKLDKEQIQNTLGLCGTQAAGLLESDHSGSMGKSLHVGRAVSNGIISAFLAKKGFTGAKKIFEGKEGFINACVSEKSTLNKKNNNLKFLLRGMGQVKVTDIYFKKYPFCRHIHSSIDTAFKLKVTLGDETNHIDNVLVKTYRIASEHNNYEPKTIGELRQSLPYAVAIALVCGDVSVDTIDKLIKFGLLEESSNMKVVNKIKNLAQKVHIMEDEKLEKLYPSKRPSFIVIKLDDHFRNGIFQNMTSIPHGDYKNPFEFTELIDKFKDLNPDYDVSKLVIIDTLEEENMFNVMKKLNG